MTSKFIIFKNIFIFLNIFFPTLSHGIELNFIETKPGLFVHYGKHEDSNHQNLGDIANVSFLIGEKSVMVVDTGGSPAIGNEIIKEIKKKTNKPISHLVVTHGHPDHFLGMSSFIKEKSIQKIIGHEKLSRSLILNFDFYQNQSLESTADSSLNDAFLVLPNLTVKSGDTLKINLGDRLIKIKAWRSGHTDNDLSIYDEKTKTILTENIFVHRTPSITASILGWKKTLEEMLEMEFEYIIPGHGEIKNKEDAINPMLNYFNNLITQIRKFHSESKDLNYALKNTLVKNKHNWLLYEEYHPRNVSRTFTELEWE